MLIKVTYDQIITLLNLKQDILLLIQVPNNPLCRRTKQVLESYNIQNRLRDFLILYLNVDRYSEKYEEISCVKIPQLRLFIKGENKLKLIGVPQTHEIDNIVYESLKW